ncbi:putative acyltransferase 3 [Mycobacterium xenopi 4042]|uniref:Putative acyltransferase 3 n=1 Tax=Mycobacterium xenopi 4042 TaxID=1299334 RepID=X8CL68_MYCXE|nr:putative acyltransferase 3 [Mycobacterium xenopi 4042]
MRAEHPKLVVVSMWRGYSPGYGVTSYDRAGSTASPSWCGSCAAPVRRCWCSAPSQTRTPWCRSACPVTSRMRTPARRHARRR